MLFAAVMLEVLLHCLPSLVPRWYREEFPPHGIEFDRPGILDRVPLGEVPLPVGVSPYDGPPPRDLCQFGFAPVEAASLDALDVPRLTIPVDDMGLPNRDTADGADVVLVGDSFVVFMAQTEPPGLQPRLEQHLGIRCLNLGVSGIGPRQERWLLEQLGLGCGARLVVWFYYGGNDLTDAAWLRHQEVLGVHTYGDYFADRRVPALFLPGLLAHWFGSNAPAAEALRSQPMRLLGEMSPQIWFHPDALRLLAMSRRMIDSMDTWREVESTITGAAAATRAAGAEFVLVYLPSKEQVYLPMLQRDPGPLESCIRASFLSVISVEAKGEELRRQLLVNREAMEEALQALCAQQGIPFWSATASLTQAARAGVQLYYRADTHWRAEAQEVVLEPLADWLTRATSIGR
jgi:hypothetical protein